MIRLKNIFILILFSIFIYACGDNNFFNDPFADVDHEALAISDNDSIVKFLQAHYYDDVLDSLKPMITGKVSMLDDTSRLKIVNLTENDIDYKLYVYVTTEGVDPKGKGTPSVVDSVFVQYEGKTFTGTSFNDSNFDSNNRVWFNLTSVVRGWSYGFPQFKAGQLKTEANGDPFNGPVTYLNAGQGYIFIPSGLGYPSSNTQNYNSPLVDTNIMFKISLLDFVKDTDHDNDGVPSLLEDLDGNNNVGNDDTDGDGIPDFFDTDDDEDGVLTKNEDKNNDGNPANDFNDPNNPTLPDYLNPNIK